MQILALTTLLLGAAVGLRLRVYALFPLILLCITIITVWAFAQDRDLWSTLLMDLTGAACLQLGYLLGSLPRFLLVAARVSRVEDQQQARSLAR